MPFYRQYLLKEERLPAYSRPWPDKREIEQAGECDASQRQQFIVGCRARVVVARHKADRTSDHLNGEERGEEL